MTKQEAAYQQSIVKVSEVVHKFSEAISQDCSKIIDSELKKSTVFAKMFARMRNRTLWKHGKSVEGSGPKMKSNLDQADVEKRSNAAKGKSPKFRNFCQKFI